MSPFSARSSRHPSRQRMLEHTVTARLRSDVAAHACVAMVQRAWRQRPVVTGAARVMGLVLTAWLPVIAIAQHGSDSHAFPWLAGASASGGTCAPPDTTAPCTPGDAASLTASEPALNLGIGNPVHLATGAKHQTDTDLPARAAHPDLEIVRHYNSLRTSSAMFGVGWRLSYDTRLVATHDGAHIMQANGERIVFDAQTDATRHGRLQRNNAGWQWHWPDGRRLDFDTHGNLVSMTRPGIPPATIVRHAPQGRLAHAIAEIRQGDHRLIFTYAWQDGIAHLRSITTPAGRFDYRVAPLPDTTAGSGVRSDLRLEAVTRPDGMQRLYLHEPEHQSGNAGLLTGIALAMPQGDNHNAMEMGIAGVSLPRPHVTGSLRIGAWDYDAQGRATGASHGERLPRDGYSRIRYLRRAAEGHDGLTMVDGPAGQTRFDIQWQDGRAVLHRVSGAWCRGCTRPGTRADYDANGHLRMINGTRLLREHDGADNDTAGSKEVNAISSSNRRSGGSSTSHANANANANANRSGSGSGSGSHHSITGIIPLAPGWPGLRIDFSTPTGASSRQWRTTLTGITTQTDDGTHRLATQRFANGDIMEVAYDPQGRPQRIREAVGDARAQAQATALTTILQWDGPRLRCLQHPHATECREYDAMGRLASRTERRPIRVSAQPPKAASDVVSETAPEHDGQHSTHEDDTWQFTERFHYDAMHRLVRHDLPEGGSLHYTWGKAQHLTSIVWQRADGMRQTVIATLPNVAGYRYGNGLHLWVARQGAASMTLSLGGPDGPYWRHTRQQDANGLVLRETHAMRTLQPGNPHHEDWRYAYDRHARLAGMQHGNATTWMAWHPDGALAAWAERRNDQTPRQRSQSNAAPSFKPDASLCTPSESNARHVALQPPDGATRPTPQTLPSCSPVAEPIIQRDAAGLPVAIGSDRLDYGANRRLIAVHRNGRTLARYVHDAYGHRIRTIWPDTPPLPAPNRMDYLYLDNRLVAQAQHGSDGRTPVITRRYLYAHHVPVGMIEYGQGGAGNSNSALYAIHADLLGAPRLITDGKARIRWLATYSPLGDAHRIAGDMTLHLRLPGQWLDPVTGWHDNLLRTYAPQWGQYLEPDPLGPLPGTQALGYAAQQPRRYVDPMGLLLFAFDGTRLNRRTDGNILKLSALYDDGASYYHSGPGNPYFLDTDAATAHRAPQILQTQWQHLLNALSMSSASSGRQTPIPIDVIGFSRGAALARHFGNLIADHTANGLFSYRDPRLGLVSACVDLRFMGLLDTVAQFGLGGSQNDRYRLNIGEAWQWVAHAVALHEHRWLFPLSSADDAGNQNVVQAPFIGAHADIGGGTLLDGSPARQGDLHDIALNWLWWQAQAAGVTLQMPAQEDQTVSAPILHDDRSALQRTLQNGDRRIDRADGTLLLPYQADHDRLGQTTRDAVEPLIRRYDGWRASGDAAVGRVDMEGYAQWLTQTLGMSAKR